MINRFARIFMPVRAGKLLSPDQLHPLPAPLVTFSKYIPWAKSIFSGLFGSARDDRSNYNRLKTKKNKVMCNLGYKIQFLKIPFLPR
ncbi:hypothetical protein MYP_3309 [Sporocytophaga myxococcoides]|uniref:Uncharacterized protein n=1 Tax=Sporocytophaga myxococcoides TaxID=153721 RepID=A0A098LGI9_9BACT|nr:hypothetical protein [Sporocytophaga myxococcoides]GAL86080.1 hypothetical protein MYP_3309 [Sporocytophaga myxococcoides]